jgi:hypothetical protein
MSADAESNHRTNAVQPFLRGIDVSEAVEFMRLASPGRISVPAAQ